MSVPPQRERNWRNILFLGGTLLAALTLVPWYTAVHGVSWSIVAMFIVTAGMTSLSITGGYHRLFAHRSYEAHPFLQALYLIWGAAAFQGSAVEWGAEHRRHHSFVDTDRDPHNIHEGFFWAHVGWLFFKLDPQYRGKFPADMRRNKLLMAQDKYYVPLAISMGFGVPALLGWAIANDPIGGFLWGGVVRVVFTNHTTFLINSLAHTMGTKPYCEGQTARDSALMAFLAYGEGYHNFHHQYSYDYRNGVRWYQWDPTKWMIGSFASLRLATKLKTVSSSEILLARVKTQQERLLALGLSEERIQAFRDRLETAQKRWAHLVTEYHTRKAALRAQSRNALFELKAEVRVARLEYRHAAAQWAAFYRTLRGLPAMPRGQQYTAFPKT